MGSNLNHGVPHTLTIEGRTKSGHGKIEAVAFHHGTVRVVTGSVVLDDKKTDLELFSDASAKTIFLHAHGKKWSTRLLLTGLANHDEAHMSVWKDAQIAPENFGLSVPALLKSKTFKDAALDGKGPELERLLGVQNYNHIPEEFEPLLAGNHKYEEFLRATEASTSKIPLALPWWCIAIFLVPGSGLFGLLIPRCRKA